MSHLHPIYDADPHFEIDPDSRDINYLSEEELILIQGDHNSERFTFELPRYIDGHDMSLCNKVYVHYINIDAENPETRSKDVYEVDDIQPHPDDEENTVVCTWLVSQNATMYIGSLNFIVSFTCVTGSRLDYVWNTGIYSGIVVREGINNGELVITNYSDVLEEWHQKFIEDSANGVNAIHNARDEVLDMIGEYGGIAVSETEPTAESVVAWVKSSSEDDQEPIRLLEMSDLEQCANAIKSTASGEIIRVDDASPVEHTVKARVGGKNLWNIYDTTSLGGVDITIDSDTIKIKAQETIYGIRIDTIPLNVGETYTFSIQSISNHADAGWGFRIKYVDGTYISAGNRNVETYTIEKEVEAVQFYVGMPYTGNQDIEIYGIQVERGDTATEYEPYVDPTTVTVTRCGKNLIPLTTLTTTPTTTTATFENGILTINGYLASHRIPSKCLVGKTLTISCESKRSGEKGGGLAIEFRDIGNARISGIYKQNEPSSVISFIVPDNTANIVFFFYGSGSADEEGTAEYKNIQLELGGSATNYEPYNGTTYVPSADGTCEIISLSPAMTLLTDTSGANIEVEYNQDANKAMANVNADITELDRVTAELMVDMGDIDTALDSIIAIQNGLMGVSE